MKKLKESQGRLRYLSAEEEQRLLAVATEPLRTIILVGIYTGLRIAAEALTLRWENIDLRKGLPSPPTRRGRRQVRFRSTGSSSTR